MSFITDAVKNSNVKDINQKASQANKSTVYTRKDNAISFQNGAQTPLQRILAGYTASDYNAMAKSNNYGQRTTVPSGARVTSRTGATDEENAGAYYAKKYKGLDYAGYDAAFRGLEDNDQNAYERKWLYDEMSRQLSQKYGANKYEDLEEILKGLDKDSTEAAWMKEQLNNPESQWFTEYVNRGYASGDELQQKQQALDEKYSNRMTEQEYNDALAAYDRGDMTDEEFYALADRLTANQKYLKEKAELDKQSPNFMQRTGSFAEAGLHNIAASGYGLGAAVGGMVTADQEAANLLAYGLIDYDEYLQRVGDTQKRLAEDESYQNYMDTMQGGYEQQNRAASLDMARGNLNGNALTKVYGDVVSNAVPMGFDALVGMATGGSSLVSMGARVYGGSYARAKSEGATEAQAQLFGMADAAKEILTEQLADGLAGIYGKGSADDVMENVIAKMTKTNQGRTALRVLYGFLSEGNEEMLADLVEPLLLSIYNGKSISENWQDEFSITNMLYDGLVGGLTSLGSAPISAVTGQYRAQNQRLANAEAQIGNAGGIAEAVLAADPENTDARQIQKALGKGKDISGGINVGPAQVANMLDASNEITVESEQQIVRDAIDARLNELGEKNTEGLSDIIRRAVSGEKLNGKEKETVRRSQYGRQVLQELLGTGDYAKEQAKWVSDLNAGLSGAADEAPAKYNLEKKFETKEEYKIPEKALSEDFKEARARFEQAMEKAKTAKAEPAEYSGTGIRVTTMDGQGTFTGLALDKEGNVAAKVKLADGTDSLSPVDTVTGLPGYVGKITDRFGSAAPAVLKGMTKGENIAAYLQNAEILYNAAINSNKTWDEAKDSVAGYKLGGMSEAAKAAIWVAAQNSDTYKYKYETRDAGERMNLRNGSLTAGNGSVIRVGKSGGRSVLVTDAAAGIFNKISQAENVRAFLEKFCAASGVDIVLFSGKDNKLTDNGMWSQSENRIFLNIDKVTNGTEFVMQAMSHEVTHFIKSHNRAGYENLKRFVVDKLLAKNEGKTLDQLIQDKINRDANFSERFKNGDDTVVEDALDEVIADGCELMLRDSSVIEELAKRDLNLAQRIAGHIRELVSKLKELFGSGEAQHEEARYLMQYAEEMQQIWDKALLGAIDSNAGIRGEQVEQTELKRSVAENAPVSYDGEVQWSRTQDEAMQQAAVDFNRNSGFVDPKLLSEAGRIRQAVKQMIECGLDPDSSIMKQQLMERGLSEAEATKKAEKLFGVWNAISNDMRADIIGETFMADSSYGGTEESTTVCVRSLAAQALMDEIAKDLGRPLKVSDTLYISQQMAQYTDKPECYYCYVATDRRAYRDFLGRYLEQRDGAVNAFNKAGIAEKYGTKAAEKHVNEWLRYKNAQLVDEEGNSVPKKGKKDEAGNIIPGTDRKSWAASHPVPSEYSDVEKLYKSFLGKREDSAPQQERYAKWMIGELHGDSISAADLASVNDLYDEVAKLAETKNRTAAQNARMWQLSDAIAYAQSASWAKKMYGFSAYNGHILNTKKTFNEDFIGFLNDHYGLRMYSFSDYSPAFILEDMQKITDASVRGLKMLAYTKEMDFVKIFADTGMNINISVFGGETNGQIYEDGMMGADWTEARQYRETHPNVGITFVATSDSIMHWAMQQDWVDVVIPYHLVRTGKEVAQYFGYKNYTSVSADGKIKGRKTAKNEDGSNRYETDSASVYPEEHGNDIVKYVRALERKGLTPRFKSEIKGWQDFLAGKMSEADFRAANPYYMKLVNETRRTAQETSPVKPIFNLDAATDSLIDMVNRGGYDPVFGYSATADEVTNKEFHNEIVSKIASGIRDGEADRVYREQQEKNAPKKKAASKKKAAEEEVKFSRVGTDSETGRGIYRSNFPTGTPKSAKAERILYLIQNVWSKQPITLRITNEDGTYRTIQAQFDPTYDESKNSRTDASKLMMGNRHGNASEKRVTLDLADDYYEIAAESVYNYSKKETGKTIATHDGVNEWHYFVNDILFKEYESDELTPYGITINVKERDDGTFVYSFNAERQNESTIARQTLHAAVNQPGEPGANNRATDDNLSDGSEKSNSEIQRSVSDLDDELLLDDSIAAEAEADMARFDEQDRANRRREAEYELDRNNVYRNAADGFVTGDKQAKWTPERMQAVFNKYSANGTQTFAYVTEMSPEDFLSLTSFETPANEFPAGPYEGDMERIRNNAQTPYLVYDKQNPGQISGHEGRHRMAALMQMGIKKVPVVVEMNNYSGQERSSMGPLKSLNVKGQGQDGDRSAGRIRMTDLVPIKKGYTEEIAKKFQGAEEDVKFSRSDDLKQQQFDMIQANHRNEAETNYTWADSVDDILTLQEAFDAEQYDAAPDWKAADIQKALRTGTVTVYSSHQINRPGTFVTPSRMEAQSYAGSGRVYSKTVSVQDVAWLDTIQGQYAPVEDAKFSKSDVDQAYANERRAADWQLREQAKTNAKEMARVKAEAEKEIEGLQRENSRLKERLEFWRNEVHESKVIKPKSADVTRLTERLFREYGTNTEDMQQVREIIDEMAGEVLSKGYRMRDLQEGAERIATILITGAEVEIEAGEFSMTVNPYEGHFDTWISTTAADILDAVIGGQEIRSEQTFADRMKARMEKAVKDAIDAEQKKQTAADKKSKAELEREVRRAYEAERKAADWELKQADNELNRERGWADGLIRHAREMAEAEAAEHLREVRKNISTRRKEAELKRKISNIKKKLDQMINSPSKSDSGHAPVYLMQSVAGLAEVLTNSESRYLTIQEHEIRDRILDLMEAGTITSTNEAYAATRLNSIAKANAELDKLQAAYERVKADPLYNTAYDDTVVQMLADLKRTIGGRSLGELNTAELEQAYKTLRGVIHSITTANQLASITYEKGIRQMSEQFIADVLAAPAAKNDFLEQFTQWQLRPDTFFDRICGYRKDNEGRMIAKMFSTGTDRMLQVQRAYDNTFHDLAANPEFRKLTEDQMKTMVDIGLKDKNGQPVKITRAMMLSIYKHLMSEDNLQAVLYGGLKVPNMEYYYGTKRSQAYGKGVAYTFGIGDNAAKITHKILEKTRSLHVEGLTETAKAGIENEIEELRSDLSRLEKQGLNILDGIRMAIEGEMTPFERQIIERSNAWYEQAADYLNEITLKMYGFKKANVENYYTIHRDLGTVVIDQRVDSQDAAANLENVGILKERVKSSAPVLLTDLFEEMNSHTQTVSRYYGFAAAQRDFNKILNYRTYSMKAANGAPATTKNVITQKFGSGSAKIGVTAEQYMNNFIKAVAGSNRADNTFWSSVRGNLPRATLTMNLRVAVSQLASIPTAAAEVGWDVMLKGLPAGAKIAFNQAAKEQLAQKDAWFWTRYKGEGGMREISESKQNVTKVDKAWNRFAESKVGKRLTNWTQDMDVLATSAMYSMAEEWVNKYQPELQGEERDNAISEKYHDIIRRTQPNYTDTERSDLLRDKREAMKILTMYKTQASQNLNVLIEANGRLQAALRSKVPADIAEAKKNFTNAATAVILGGTVGFVFIRFVADMLLNSMKKYRDDDDELTAKSVLGELANQTMSSLLSMCAFGSEMYDVLHAIVSGDRYYGLSDSAISAVSDISEAFVKFGQKAVSGELDWKTAGTLTINMANVFGIPVNNVKTLVTGMVNHGIDIANGEPFGFEAGVERTAAQNSRRYIEAALKGDTEKSDAVFKDMAAGYSSKKDPEKEAASQIKSNLRKLFKNGDCTEEEARQILKGLGMADNDIYWKLQEWQADLEEDQSYSRYLTLEDAIVNGGDIKGALKELTSHGVTDSTAKGQVKSIVKEQLLDGKISKQQAAQILRQYAGMEREKADAQITSWITGEEIKEGTGYTYSNWRQAFSDSSVKDADLDKIIGNFAGQSLRYNYEKIRKLGYSARNTYQLLQKADSDGNGTIKKQELFDYIISRGMGREEAERLWACFGWKSNYAGMYKEVYGHLPRA